MAESEEEYSLERSLKGRYGQIVPCLADVNGEVFDGLHRKNVDGKAWTIKVPQIKTAVDRTFGRMIVNKVRRKYRSEELTEDIGFLMGAGYNVQQIVDITGISERSVYRYMPQELKKPEPAQLVEAHRKTSDIVPAGTESEIARQELVECQVCGMGTRSPQPFGKYANLCERCFSKATQYPRLFMREEPKPKIVKPQFKDSWEHRKARMHPQHSNMELALQSRLYANNFHAETDHKFCLESTTPDFYFPNQRIAVYVDGVVHKGKEQRDTALRDKLAKRHNLQIVSIPYESFTKQEVNRVYTQIVQTVTNKEKPTDKEN